MSWRMKKLLVLAAIYALGTAVTAAVISLG